jgi:hypothetical protein
MSREDLFLRFWEAYPRKMAIKDAKKAFIEAVEENGYSPHFLIEKAELFAENVNPNELEWVPYPATWLREARFEDHDLFTDQVNAKRLFLKRCWRNADVKAMYDEYGLIYKKPPPAEGLSDEELRKWDSDQKRLWIAQKATELLGENRT